MWTYKRFLKVINNGLVSLLVFGLDPKGVMILFPHILYCETQILTTERERQSERIYPTKTNRSLAVTFYIWRTISFFLKD